jgi:hypothetical protein
MNGGIYESKGLGLKIPSYCVVEVKSDLSYSKNKMPASILLGDTGTSQQIQSLKKAQKKKWFCLLQNYLNLLFKFHIF